MMKKKFYTLDTCGLYYKHVTIINDNSSVVNKWSFKLIDDPRVVIYDRHMLKYRPLVGTNLTRLERPKGDKHSSLVLPFVSYDKNSLSKRPQTHKVQWMKTQHLGFYKNSHSHYYFCRKGGKDSSEDISVCSALIIIWLHKVNAIIRLKKFSFKLFRLCVESKGGLQNFLPPIRFLQGCSVRKKARWWFFSKLSIFMFVIFKRSMISKYLFTFILFYSKFLGY